MLIKLLVVLCVSFITVTASPDFLDSRIRPVQGEPCILRISGCDEGCTLTIRGSGGSPVLPNDNARTPSHTFTLSGLLEGTYSFKLTNNVDNGIQFSTTFYLYDSTKPSPTSSSTTSTSAPPRADSTDTSDESSEGSSSLKKKKKKSKKLKPGALAGIVVGAVTAVLGVLGAFLRWRKKKKDGGKDKDNDGQPKQSAASSH